MPLPNKEEWNNWDIDLRTASGHTSGVYSYNKFAQNPAVGTTLEDIWFQGGVLSYLTTAETLSIASSSPSDNGSPGAGTVRVYGVDDNYIPVSEIVTLTGTTPVVTSQAFLRVNRMKVLTAGSTQTNVGNITATATTAATVQASIPALSGSTSKSQFTVPDGYFAFISTFSSSASTATTSLVTCQMRPFGAAWTEFYEQSKRAGSTEIFFKTLIRLDPKSDCRVQAVRVGGSDVAITSFMGFKLVEADLVNDNLPMLGF